MTEATAESKVLQIADLSVTVGCTFSLVGGQNDNYFGLGLHPGRFTLVLPEKYEAIVRVFSYFSESSHMEMALKAGATIIKEDPGAYGGTALTVQIDLETLNAWCRQVMEDRQDIFGPPDPEAPSCYSCGATRGLR